MTCPNLLCAFNNYYFTYYAIDTLQIQFGACQKWKSKTIEVLLTFYYYNKTI